MTFFRQQSSKLYYRLAKQHVYHALVVLNDYQWLTRQDLELAQHKNMLALLEYANTWVPYYQNLFKQINFTPADFAADPASFQKIPLLTKQDIRRHYNQLITTQPSRRQYLIQVQTGGTTGEPLNFMQDQTYRIYNNAYVYHNMQLSDWQLGDPQFWLWGHHTHHNSHQQKTNTLSEWIALFANRFDSNAFILTPQSMEKLACRMERNPHGALWSYVSTAYHFAQFLAKRGHTIKLKAVFTAAEPLFPAQRAVIESVLGCPVFNNYSSVDTGSIARECEHHTGLHIATRNVYVEIVNNSQVMPAGQSGEIVITNLLNYGMPLIRYNIEDQGSKSLHQCSCGRAEPMLEQIEGRRIDIFKTRDGRMVYGAFAHQLFTTLGDVKQFQITQKTLDLVVFTIVAGEPIASDKLYHLETITKEALGQQVQVQFDFVDSIPSTLTGKHRYLVSEVS